MAIQIYFDGRLIKQLGTYVKTDLSAVRQINGVATGVIGVAGLAEGGPVETPVKILSHAEAVAVFKGGPLVDHIQALFLGGAGEVVALRLKGNGISPSSVNIQLENGTNDYTLQFRSLEQSSRANSIFVQLMVDEGLDGSSSDDHFVLTVYQKNPDCSIDKEVYEVPRRFTKKSVLVRRENRLFFVQDWVIEQAKFNAEQATTPNFTVSLASTANIGNLADAGSTMDGSTVVNGAKVLLKNQTTASENGIYTATVVGTTVSLTRDTIQPTAGQIVKVNGGATQANTKWSTGVSGGDYSFTLLAASENEFIRSILQDVLQPDDKLQLFEAGDPVPVGLLVYEVNEGGLFGHERSRLVSVTVDNETAPTLEIVSLFNQSPDTFFDSANNPPTYVFPPSSENVVLTGRTLDGLITNNPALLSDIYALTGGSNGDDGTGFYGTGTLGINGARTAWIDALKVFETEEVNFIQPAYRFHPKMVLSERETFFTTIGAFFVQHANGMSQVHQRKRRVVILGYPAPEKENFPKSVYLSGGQSGVYGATKVLTALGSGTDRVQTWVAPFKSPVFSGRTELLGGEFFASYMAGKHANREPQFSVTFEPVGGLGAEFLYQWTYQEKDLLISQRLAFVEKVKNSFGAELNRIHHNPTSWLGAVTVGYQEMVLRRIDDFVTTYIFKNLEAQFIGRPSLGAKTSDQIRSYTESLLSNLRGRQIVEYKDVKVTANEDKTVYYVEFFFQPVTEIKFIPVTMKLSFDLA